MTLPLPVRFALLWSWEYRSHLLRSLVVLIMASVVGIPASASNFITEVVDPRLTVGTGTSLALDQLGRPRVAYRFGGGGTGANGDLYFASRETGAWTFEPVDTLGDVGWGSSLVMGADDVPHISYSDFTDNALKYATLQGGNWVTELVDQPPAGSFVQAWTSMALDSNGEPHIAYYVNNVPLFRYASRHEGVWSVEIAGFLEFALWISLKLDDFDVPHISYWDARNHVKYATRTSGVWSFEVVDTLGNFAPGYSSLAFGPGGVPAVAYYRPTSGSDGDLALASRTGGVWSTELVDTAGTTGHTPSLKFGSDGPRISYFDITNGFLRHARKAPGSWLFDVVDAQPNSGSSSSLALGSGGETWISYLAADASNQSVHLMAAHEIPTIAVGPLGEPSFSLLRVWPNPGAGEVNVSLATATSDPVTLELIDVTGRIVAARTFTATYAGAKVVTLGCGGETRPGVYHLRLTQRDRRVIRKVVLLRPQ